MTFKKPSFSLGDLLHFEDDEDPFSEPYNLKYMGDSVLDLRNVLVYGFERNQSREIVMNLCRALEHGDILPNVPVTQLSPDEYCLIPEILKPGYFGTKDGGHHRTLAYLITGIPMPVSTYDCSFIPSRVNILMDGTTMVSDQAALERRMHDDPHFHVYHTGF